MSKLLLFSFIALVFLNTPVVAQKVNTDSLKLVAEMSQDQLKLGKLQNMVDQKTINKQNAITKSRDAANSNVSAAQNLNSDPDNKQLANDAGHRANDAKTDSDKSRKETAKLDELNKNIIELIGRINAEQAKLNVFTQSNVAASALMQMPVQTDSTRHP